VNNSAKVGQNIDLMKGTTESTKFL